VPLMPCATSANSLVEVTSPCRSAPLRTQKILPEPRRRCRDSRRGRQPAPQVDSPTVSRWSARGAGGVTSGIVPFELPLETHGAASWHRTVRPSSPRGMLVVVTCLGMGHAFVVIDRAGTSSMRGRFVYLPLALVVRLRTRPVPTCESPSGSVRRHASLAMKAVTAAPA
jgi:hypothetical protein